MSLNREHDPDTYAEQQMKLLGTMTIRKEGNWFIGTIAGYEFFAKVYQTGSKYGIGEGRISKLTVRQTPVLLSQPPHSIINYDRGWDVEPQTDYDRLILDTLVEYFENLPAEEI